MSRPKGKKDNGEARAAEHRDAEWLAQRAVKVIREAQAWHRIAAKFVENSNEERQALEWARNACALVGHLICHRANPAHLLRLVADKLEGKSRRRRGRRAEYDAELDAAWNKAVKEQMERAKREGRKIKFDDFAPLFTDLLTEWLRELGRKGKEPGSYYGPSRNHRDRTLRHALERRGMAARPGKPGRPREKKS